MDKRYEQLERLAAARAARRSRAEPVSDKSTAASNSPTPLDRDFVSTRLVEAVSDAAVSGSFDPQQLFGPDEGEELKMSVMSRLAPLCIIPEDSETKWTLSISNREQALKSAESPANLLHERLPETDTFGVALRAAIAEGASAAISVDGQNQAMEALAAVRVLQGIGLPVPDTSPLEAEIAKGNFLSDYSSLLETPCHGRSQQFEKLREFLKTDGLGDWSSIVISGLGGSGKSTLVANFLSESAKRNEATIATVDFDRPGIDASELHLLELEITRQIGYQRPELEADLKKERAAVRETRDGSSRDGFESERIDRATRILLRNVRSILEKHHLEDRPILLVLDTMEEVVVSGHASRLIGWLDDVCSAIDPLKLKVIFSGRLTGTYDDDEDPEGLPDAIRAKEPAKVVLGELSKRSSAKVLIDQGIQPSEATVLLAEDLIPKRPLELRLLARLLRDGPTKNAAALVKDLREDGSLAKGMFAGVVYRRVLQRIKNEDVKELAHPGLVLRYVTQEIVEHVLAPALQLQLTSERIKEATKGLASYAWLASKQPDGTIWHRRDLRRSTLKAMIAEKPSQARAINQAARKYFSAMSDQRSQAEALYHSLMLVTESSDLESFDMSATRRLAKHFSPDIADLPLPAQVFVRRAQRLPVRFEDILLLPSRYRDAAIQDAGKRFVAGKEFGSAAELIIGSSSRVFRTATPHLGRLENWEAEALFGAAEWREFVERSDQTTYASRFDSLQALTEAIFPRELASPLRMTGTELDERIDVASIAKQAMSLQDGGAEYTGRIALGLAMIDSRSPIGLESANLATRLLRIGQQARIHPGVGPRQMLLIGISCATDWLTAKFRTSHLVLSEEWLEDFRRELQRRDSNSSVALIDHTLGMLRSTKITKRPPYIREMLARIDGVEGTLSVEFPMHWHRWSMEDAMRYLRGPDPELRDPLRYALAECVDEMGPDSIFEIIRSLLPYQFQEIESRSFRNALKHDAVKALVLPIELIDRCGKRPQLIQNVLRQRPISTKIRDVAGSYVRLDNGVKYILSRFSNRSDFK